MIFSSSIGPPPLTLFAMITPLLNGWHGLLLSPTVSRNSPRFSLSWHPIPALVLKAGKLDDALLAFETMRKLIDGRPIVAVYNVLIHGYVKCGQHDKVTEIYNRMLKDRVKPDVFTFNILISSYCRNKKFEMALELFREMREKGCSPNVVSFNTLIMGFFRERKFDEGVKMAYEMIDLGCGFQV
ncbi:hypothetical protein GH714_038981 [Hevea brasiliensis]|uniref:Pentacotripeptide-repeat region of PRORP domain-containing protein n=1 Tax=Hevea brasiliensis TaxID=3981 RepID=A0A6A6KB07_HEVBR|nr:hypothetical protein GH714_038981 [Hevea brasiliensis]